MGYNTRYNLTWESLDKVNRTKEISEFLNTHRDDFYAINNKGRAESCCKWYEHEDSMKIIAKAFPKVLFTLSGEGEESGDLWKHYFVGLKSQREKAQIVFDPPDMSKLVLKDIELEE